MTTFDTIRQEGRMLYEYVRGSHLYGLNNEDSDVDTGGVFICSSRELLCAVPAPVGTNVYQPQVSDSRHDHTWFEIGEFIRLALKSNPSVLEALFVPEKCIIGKVDPLMRWVLDERDRFLSKDVLTTMYGYAKEQIYKARGLNKKIVNPVKKRLSPFDFIYTFKGQGSTKLRDWLNDRGLYSDYCGLVNVPKMHDVYGVYYDFGRHREEHPECLADSRLIQVIATVYGYSLAVAKDYLLKVAPTGYKGIVAEDGSSNEPRLSAVWDKQARPICHISYNQSGYSAHCREYKQYQEWVQNRNEKRYRSNLDKNYDSKNMMHCFRLLRVAREIATGQGVNLERTADREFLLAVRNHQFEYDELIEMVEREKSEMKEEIERSPLPDHVDAAWAGDLLLQLRVEQLKRFPL